MTTILHRTKKAAIAVAIAAVIASAIVPLIAMQAVPAPADATLPGFEASIKRNQAGDGMMGMRMDTQGRTISGLPLRQLIVQSYGVQPNQVIGGPDWLATDRWD